MERRRVWPWVVLAIILLILAVLLLGSPRHETWYRVASVAALEIGWLLLIFSVRAWLVGRAGLVGRALGIAAKAVLVAGIGAAALGGWLGWKVATSDPTSHHDGHWDWD